MALQGLPERLVGFGMSSMGRNHLGKDLDAPVLGGGNLTEGWGLIVPINSFSFDSVSLSLL